MGRAYEVRKASIQKTGAARGKIYSNYAKEIYQAAKNGGVTPEGNPALKRLIEKAKKEQVPGDVIKRAIDKKKNSKIIDCKWACVVGLWRLIPNWLWYRLPIQ